MLNSIHKYYFALFDNRLKSTLESVISPDQTGFIANRFIGDNTRLLYDTLNYCKVEH